MSNQPLDLEAIRGNLNSVLAKTDIALHKTHTGKAMGASNPCCQAHRDIYRAQEDAKTLCDEVEALRERVKELENLTASFSTFKRCGTNGAKIILESLIQRYEGVELSNIEEIKNCFAVFEKDIRLAIKFLNEPPVEPTKGETEV